MNPAQSARLSKEKYPNEWCRAKGCLWRTATRQGYKPCPKHPSEAERTTVSYGGSHSDVASEPDGERARSTVRLALAQEREAYLRNADHRSCQCPKCRTAF